MKFTIFYIFALSFYACNSNTQQNETFVSDVNETEIEQVNTEFDGIWILTNYLDSIVEYRSISKYRTQIPSWFSIVLNIEYDSIDFFGSFHEFENIPFFFNDDTICKIKSRIGGDYYLRRTKNPNQLIMEEYFVEENKYHDSGIYIFEKRGDMKYLLDSLPNRDVLKYPLTKFFNEHILAGTYEFISPENYKGQELKLNTDGSMIGFNDYITYNIRAYFGTFHPHNNLDVVYFDTEQSQWIKGDDYHWNFEADKLILTQFIQETINENGEIYGTDNRILGSKKYILKRVSD